MDGAHLRAQALIDQARSLLPAEAVEGLALEVALAQLALDPGHAVHARAKALAARVEAEVPDRMVDGFRARLKGL
jgi:hypothetical protein